MSIPATDNQSLLASLATLRPGNNSFQQDRGFSNHLNKAVTGESTEAATANKARAMAELLTLQMLQTSLSLTSDGSSDSTQKQSTSSSLPSLRAFIQAYSSNQPESGEKQITPTTTSPLTLQNIPTVSTPPTGQSSSRSGVAWLDPIIARASQLYGVDVSLIKAVIKAESNFNPQAISHAGARGLMQLMPATARSLGVKDSFDPEQNIMAGTRFLGDMLKRYDGNIDSALAAYNWGPGNVDKRPDRLPRETRDYQARVKQLYSSYTA